MEPVAWASGLKDLLCGFLSLLAIWQYVAFAQCKREERARYWHYVFATAAFALALLSKPTAVVVPAISFAIDFGLVRRSPRAGITAAVPWVLLAIPCAVWTHLVQPAALPIPTPWWAKPWIAGDAIGFYLWKLMAPVSLCVDYRRDPGFVLGHAMTRLVCMIPVIVALMLWRLRIPALIVAGAIVLIGIGPVLGLVPFSFQSRSTVADHYFYLSGFGVALAGGWLVMRLPRSQAFWGCAVVLAALGLRSLDQTRYWKDSWSLFAHTVAVNPSSYSAYQNLAVLSCYDAELSAAGRRSWPSREIPQKPSTTGSKPSSNSERRKHASPMRSRSNRATHTRFIHGPRFLRDLPVTLTQLRIFRGCWLSGIPCAQSNESSSLTTSASWAGSFWSSISRRRPRRPLGRCCDTDRETPRLYADGPKRLHSWVRAIQRGQLPRSRTEKSPLYYGCSMYSTIFCTKRLSRSTGSSACSISTSAKQTPTINRPRPTINKAAAT